MNDDRNELDVAEALAAVAEQRARGESGDVFAWRDRLGGSHAEFVDLVELDAMIDEVTDPVLPEPFPRDFGNFTLLRELGRGAIGVVYEAVHKTLKRRAAVKVLRSGFDRHAEARDRFRREAYATAKVRHPNIVEIFDAGEIGRQPFYAMELVEGHTLASTIAANEPATDVASVRELCRRVARIADALDALHHASEKPIVHRDVKPSNIMVRPDGELILADFGLARANDGLDLTRTGVAVGTPLYMPPEQMLGDDDVDARADVYSLGATLYEAISGRTVFPASSFLTVQKQVVSERPAGLRKFASHCPEDVERIVMKALAKRREDRFESAAQMRDALLAAADGREVDAKPPGRVVEFLRWLKTPIGLAAAAGFVLAIGAGVFAVTRPVEPGKLELSSLPAGVDVRIAGVSRGQTPLSLALAPGTYDIVLHSDGFEDRPLPVDLRAGGFERHEVILRPSDPDDPLARSRIFESLDLGTPEVEEGRMRGDADVLLLVYPRGNVRLADIDRLSYDVGPTFFAEEGAELEVRRGDVLLHHEKFEPRTAGNHTIPLPAGVRAALRVGDEVTWGIRTSPRAPRAGARPEGVFAKFTLVDVDPSASIAQVARRLEGLSGDARQKAIVAEAQARVLSKAGLSTAALLRADAIADANPTSLPAQVLALRAYVDMRAGESVRAAELRERIDHFPAAARDRLKSALPGAKHGVR